MKTFVSFLALTLAALASTAAQSQTLTIKITGVTSTVGKMMIAIYNAESTFRKSPTIQTIAAPVTGTTKVDVQGLPAGKYAVTLFQDVNNDGKLNTKMFGIPSEPWGASNNGTPFAGAPTWNTSHVSVPASGATITIELN